MFIIRGKWTWS